MEIKKISFKEKNDVQKQWIPFSDEHFDACNYDCTEWRLKTLGDKVALQYFSPCYQTETAKDTIWF